MNDVNSTNHLIAFASIIIAIIALFIPIFTGVSWVIMLREESASLFGIFAILGTLFSGVEAGLIGLTVYKEYRIGG